MQDELSERQSTILKLIVQEYIRTGRAIGSKSLLERFRLGVSPATVRNEMGELEDQQFLVHPHTSAGRVPTDRGYRYYVEYLLEDARLPVTEQITIRHQFGQVEMQIETWVRLAATIAADLSGNMALVTPPRGRIERLRHFELISLRDHIVLLIVVTQAGTVREVILPQTEPIAQQDLSGISQRLNPELANLTSPQVLERANGTTGLAAAIMRQVADAIRPGQQEVQSELVSEGLDRVLQQPEMSQSAMAHRLLELLRGGMILSELLPQLEFDDDVQVIIGTENRSRDLQPFGVVVASYGTTQEITGVLGIVGPTRMPYGRSISAVRFLSRLLSELLRDVYHQEADSTA
ncbi:MAG TPA: heat-inducible transcriptional repressor HrcA [Thermomicrobiaceae bacterium]|nr:heat-inducible transcriptional repressor HrcA [Thermomicrobiaceae bacterium]